MGKHSSDAESSNRDRYAGTHRRPEASTNNPGSFWVNSPERVARGVGDRQTGGRDD